MPKMIYICILLIYFKVISKKRGSLLPPLTLYVTSNVDTNVLVTRATIPYETESLNGCIWVTLQD